MEEEQEDDEVGEENGAGDGEVRCCGTSTLDREAAYTLVCLYNIIHLYE